MGKKKTIRTKQVRNTHSLSEFEKDQLVYYIGVDPSIKQRGVVFEVTKSSVYVRFYNRFCVLGKPELTPYKRLKIIKIKK